MINPNAQFLTLPFPLDECPERGIRPPQNTSQWPRVKSFEIRDPEAAARWLPFARHLRVKTQVVVPNASEKKNQPAMVAFHSSVPITSWDDLLFELAMDSVNGFVFVRPSDLPRFKPQIVNGLRFLTDAAHFHRRFQQIGTPVFLAANRGSELFLSEVAIDPSFEIPENAKPRPVITPGMNLRPKTLFYRLRDLFKMPETKAVPLAKEMEESRLQYYREECPHFFSPSEWNLNTPKEMEYLIKSNRRRTQGWVTKDELLAALSLPDEQGLSEILAKFTESFRPKPEMQLFKPVTLRQIAESGRLPEFVSAVFDCNAEFVARLMTCPAAKLAALSHLIKP